jgi:hypothetical protein
MKCVTALAFAALAFAAIGAGACSTTPTVSKTKAMMTPAEIAALDLECKSLKPIDSNIPKTICASDSAWDRYAEATRQATDDLLAKGREVR